MTESTGPTDEPDASAPGTRAPCVVGIGASAGGIEALQKFFGSLPDGHVLAFVVIMHLDPDRKSVLAELLQRFTEMPVRQITERITIEPDHVYVIPPGRNLFCANGHLDISEFEGPRSRRAPIDHFFRSLAAMGERSVALVLSGSGSDGTLGARAVKEAGGLVFVQEPADASHDSMPRSAIRGAPVDVVGTASALAHQVGELEKVRARVRVPDTYEELPDGDSEVLFRILTQLRSRTGHDFSRYKKSTVLRRIGRRMQVTGAESLSDYLERLRDDGAEAESLLKDLLISVTHFFRDPEAWEALEEKVIPTLFERHGADSQIRVWAPGCATGEEAFSLAIALIERAGRMTRAPRIHVFASDLDENALAVGREGAYPRTIEADVPSGRLQRFFSAEGDHFRVREGVREHVLFAGHSLLRDPPFSRVDLITCRNVLIYFEREIQRDILELFHYALRPDGFLFLGNAESAEIARELFEPLDKKHRIYVRRPAPAVLPSLPLPVKEPTAKALRRHAPVPDRLSPAERHGAMLERLAPPSVVVDRDHALVHLSDSAGRFLLRPAGTPSNEILREVRPELRVDLQEALSMAFEEGAATSRGPIEVSLDGETCHVHLVVQPGAARGKGDGERSGEEEDLALVVFVESQTAGVPHALAPGGGALEDPRVPELRAEVQRLRERMQTTIEEYESSQEEMRAANEELQSINEEHKSTAEELETSKEELQSVNEELETVNQELKSKIEQVSQANSDLQNLMASTEIGTLFLDRSLRIQRYTPLIAQLFNVMPADRGRPIQHLTHAVEYDDLAADAEAVLRDLATLEREVAGPDGSWLLVRLRPYRTVDDVIEGVVITFVDITRRKEAEDGLRALTDTLEDRVRERTGELERARDLFYQVFHSSPVPMLMTDVDDGGFIDANEAYLALFRLDRGELAEKDLLNWHWPDPAERDGIFSSLRETGRVRNREMEVELEPDDLRTALVFMETVQVEDEARLLSAFVDITERKQATEKARGLASVLTRAEQQERDRVAQLLHDDLQQQLFSVKYKLASLRGADGGIEKDGALQEVEGWLDTAIETTRQLTVDLSPPILSDEGLPDALQWLASQMERMHRLEVTVEAGESPSPMDAEMRILLVQSVRELLFNIVKHAGVPRARIRTAEEGGSWLIEVQDEGAGFDPDRLDEEGVEEASGFGLRNLRDRIGLFGGELEIESAPDNGTHVTLRMPVGAKRSGDERTGPRAAGGGE